jgi:RNA polymerase primary sigma factor
MPISPRFHTEQVREFTLQIERAPETVRRKQMKAAEHLIQEVVDDALYPFDYLIYRVTGYRSEEANQPILLGSALLGDLVSLVARVSRTLQLSANKMLTIQETAQHLNISTRTLSRLRSEGFVFYWVVEKGGRQRLGCSKEMIESYCQHNPERMQVASAFSRLTDAEQQEIVTLALKYNGDKKTLSEVSNEIAKSSARGHETIRNLLQQSDLVKAQYSQPRRLTRRCVREIEQLIQQGSSWEELQKKYNRTPGAIRKALVRLRATRLKKMVLSYVDLPVFERSDAEDIILGSPAAQNVSPPILLLDSLDFSQVERLQQETAIVSAMHLLRKRASDTIASLLYSPSAKVLDRIETDLRWSYLLQQKLVIEAMAPSLSVALQHAGRPLHELPSNKLEDLINHVIQVVGESCGNLDPAKGQTAIRTPSSILDRSIPLLDAFPKPLRAAAKFKPIEILCPFHGIVPWSFLIPTGNVHSNALQQSSELGEVVELRYGWIGPPLTIEEIAHRLNRSPLWVARQLHTYV